MKQMLISVRWGVGGGSDDEEGNEAVVDQCVSVCVGRREGMK